MSVLIKQAGLISAADFVRLFVKTIIGLVLARLLTQAEFGTYRQLFMIYTILFSVFMIGLPQSIYYFLPKSDDETKKKFIKQTIDLFTIVGLAGSILLVILRQNLAAMFNNDHLSKILLVFAFYPFFMFLSQLYYNVMIGLQKPKNAALFVFFSVSCDLVLILGTAILTKNLIFITFGIVLSVFVQWLFARINLQKYISGTSLFSYHKELLSTQLKFSLPIGVAAIVGVISAQVDKLVISSYFTPDLFAVFSIGATELPFMGIIVNSVNAVILPEMSKRNDISSICDLYQGAVRKNALLLFPMFAFCFLFAPHIIQILYTAKYMDAVLIFRIYLFSIPVRIATYGLLFQVFNRTRFIFYISIVTLVLNTMLSLLFIRLFGLKGPAISTIIVTYINVAFYLLLIRSKLQLNLNGLFPLNSILKTAAAVIISILICFPILFIPVNVWVQLLAGIIVFCIIYYFIGFWLRAIQKYDRELLITIMNEVFSKIKKMKVI